MGKLNTEDKENAGTNNEANEGSAKEGRVGEWIPAILANQTPEGFSEEVPDGTVLDGGYF